MQSRRYLAWLLLLPLLLPGCGKSGPKLAPVSGRVTLDKKPLVDALVTFTPAETGPTNIGNPESSARTDDQGRYSLKTNQDKRDGALIGTHKVRISVIERGTSIVNRVPRVYNQDTTLTFTVPAEGTKEANFDLTSDGKGK